MVSENRQALKGRLDGSQNELRFSGEFTAAQHVRRFAAAYHNLVGKQKYSEVHLDFRDCAKAYPGAMVGLCALSARYRRQGVESTLRLPANAQLRSVFLNSGWAHLINPESQPPSRYTGAHHLGAIQFSGAAEQQAIVNRFVNALLGMIEQLRREDLAAIEWSINELTDNVLNHAQSPAGGVIHLSHFRQRKFVEFAIADAGLGIPQTLRSSLPAIVSDVDALDKAIREGVTRDPEKFQGNGLFGSFRIAELCKGHFSVHSGYASLAFGKDGLHLRTEQIPYPGTLIISGLDCESPETLGAALSFKGKRHYPVDFIELHYEHPKAEILVFRVHDEVDAVGSRVAGEPVRKKLLNLVRMGGGMRIVVDFADVPLVSSSFADEVFGQLFVELGPIGFNRAFEFKNMSDTVRSLVDRAILQRSQGRRM